MTDELFQMSHPTYYAVFTRDVFGFFRLHGSKIGVCVCVLCLPTLWVGSRCRLVDFHCWVLGFSFFDLPTCVGRLKAKLVFACIIFVAAAGHFCFVGEEMHGGRASFQFSLVFLVNASQGALFRNGSSGALGFIVEPNLYLGYFSLPNTWKQIKGTIVKDKQTENPLKVD